LLRQSKTEASATGGGALDHTGAKVLVADNDDQSAEITRRVLERVGFTVDRAQDLDDAMARLAISKPPFACVVVDFDEASAQTLKLLEAIRASDDAEVVTTPVVICADIDANRRFSWQSGADGFIVRPFHIDDLLQAVQSSISRTGEDRARFRREQAGLVGG
jgi:DNA-binding response OmpR family regulator